MSWRRRGRGIEEILDFNLASNSISTKAGMGKCCVTVFTYLFLLHSYIDFVELNFKCLADLSNMDYGRSTGLQRRTLQFCKLSFSGSCYFKIFVH